MLSTPSSFLMNRPAMFLTYTYTVLTLEPSLKSVTVDLPIFLPLSKRFLSVPNFTILLSSVLRVMPDANRYLEDGGRMIEVGV